MYYIIYTLEEIVTLFYVYIDWHLLSDCSRLQFVVYSFQSLVKYLLTSQIWPIHDTYIYFYAYMFTVSWINTNLFAFGFVHCERKKLNLNTINMHRHHASTRTDIQLQNAVTLYSNKINIRLENTVEWKNTHTHTQNCRSNLNRRSMRYGHLYDRISSRVEVWKCIKQNSCINAKY